MKNSNKICSSWKVKHIFFHLQKHLGPKKVGQHFTSHLCKLVLMQFHLDTFKRRKSIKDKKYPSKNNAFYEPHVISQNCCNCFNQLTLWSKGRMLKSYSMVVVGIEWFVMKQKIIAIKFNLQHCCHFWTERQKLNRTKHCFFLRVCDDTCMWWLGASQFLWIIPGQGDLQNKNPDQNVDCFPRRMWDIRTKIYNWYRFAKKSKLPFLSFLTLGIGQFTRCASDSVKNDLTIEVHVAVEVADSSVRVNRFIGCHRTHCLCQEKMALS